MESDFSRVKHARVSNTRNRNGFSQRRRDTLRMWGGNVTGQQLQPCVWALPPKPQKRVVHTFTWGVQREKQWSCPHNERVYSTQRSVVVLRGNYYFAGCGDKSILWPVLTKFWRQTISPTWGDRSGNVCVFGSDITDGTYSSRQASGLLDENGAALLSILRTNDGTC